MRFGLEPAKRNAAERRQLRRYAFITLICGLLITACGIFGGVFIGLGVAMNFAGGGSSGGVDVLIAIAHKYLGVKESIASFVIDSSIIICGMFIIPKNIVPSFFDIL